MTVEPSSSPLAGPPPRSPWLPRLRAFAMLLLVMGGVALARLNASAASQAPPAEAEPDSAAERSHAAPAEATPAPPQYVLGKELDGRFDLTVLRDGARVRELRYGLPDITEMFGPQRNWRLTLGYVVEFGAPTGMAEVQRISPLLSEAARGTISHMSPSALLSPGGQYRLKQALIAGFNRQFKTAQVRQIYITEILIERLG